MAKCDICGGNAKYDAKLNVYYGGCWAHLCDKCFEKHSMCSQLNIAPQIGYATVL